ncbi:glycosyltransferase family 1 protein [Enterococcus hulanensis]|uniref:glycosyltransferase family 1 protein n=1 Tax=Enterococcus hulanensis TaxID=2559929 RepID=UPI0010F772B1|nr:glycosyltransferase family 1 protein [Enterococcus hulanensis]
MPTQQSLGQRQIFGMKRESLQKKVQKFYSDTQNAAAVVEVAIAVMIRNSFVVGDFSLLFAELIHEIYLHTEATDLLRRFCPFFENYFDHDEWKLVKARMFKNSKDYRKLNDSLCGYKKYLQEKTTPVEELDGQRYKLISVFEDANGKLHTWNLGDADPEIAIEKADALLRLLTTLTIFQKAGVRRFVKVEKSDIVNCTRKTLVQKEKVHKEDEVSEQISADTDMVNSSDDMSMSVANEEGNVTPPMEKEPLRESLSKKTHETAPSSLQNSNATAMMTEEQNNSTSRKPSMALSAYQKSKAVYKKPKSERQKDREYKEELLKGTKYGKKNKHEARKKKKKRK